MNLSTKNREPFWKTKSLVDMTPEEWDALCDGCGRCCLEKLEDKDADKIFYTAVACRFLDTYRCSCMVYEQRKELVPDCLWLTSNNIKQFHWLPATCAYRLLSEGKDLQWWHPLVSGDANTVHKAGISVRNKVISEKYVHPDELEAYIIDWEL
jgi:uncharacterized cysteine cluster protein YcgN (CxxCxxCC family)